MGIFLQGENMVYTVFRLAEIFLPARLSWSFFVGYFLADCDSPQKLELWRGSGCGCGQFFHA